MEGEPIDSVVLVVDDDEAICEMLVESIHGRALAFVASTARQAISIAGQVWPDVVVLDLALPDPLDGLNVARSVRSQFTKTPQLVVISAMADGEHIAAALRADAFFAKPFDLEHLTATVLELAGNPASAAGSSASNPAR